MPPPFQVNITEQCTISPPPDSTTPPSIKLPLTFLDIPWLLYPPHHTLLFFPKPPPKTTITTFLKHSLSLTLHHFHPLAGNLHSPPPPAEPYIIYTKGDSISLTIAESNTTISHLSSDHPKPINNLHSLLPHLPLISNIHVAHLIPLLSIQITIFNDSGYSIGLTTQHVTADERTLDKFMKHWANVCSSLSEKQDSFDAFSTRTTLSFDRRVIPNPNSLKTSFLKHWWDRDRSDIPVSVPPKHCYVNNVVQATFRVTPSQINKIKQHILEQCKMINEDPPVHLSPYVSACAYIWICLLKVNNVQEPRDSKDGPVYLGFNAGGITRLGCEGDIPLGYFGNCIAFGRCMVMKSVLLGDYAIVFAAKSLGKEIKRLDGDVLGGADRWISDWDELDIRVLGSPKVDSYGLDFGWGKVQKVEKISSNNNNNNNNNNNICMSNNNGRVMHVVSLSGNRDMKGGMEIGIVLSKEKMSVFSCVFNEGLMELA